MIETKQAYAGNNGSTRPVVQLSSWWRDTVAIEQDLDYRGSSSWSRAAWDDLIAKLMLAPSEALYSELRDCVGLWFVTRQDIPSQTLLDAFVATAWREGLSLADHAILVAFRLRQELLNMRHL
jgi:hypothetical protein